jgi:sigma-B regulation protein RsbU (phosphoserine phosphatase)
MARINETRRHRAIRPAQGKTSAHGSGRTHREVREAKKDQKAKEELQADLSAAAEVQASLLPERIPQIPGYDIYAYYRSAKEVGGDYYDFFPLDAERLGLVIADVSGKGVPGAMVMAATRALIRVLGPMSGSCSETLKQTNFHVARDVRRGMFVTAIMAVLTIKTRQMTVCSAGHNPMVVYKEKAQKCGLLNPGGIALGFDKGPIFDRILKESTITLEPGDRVVLYTDGVVEAMNVKHEEYGDDRFYQFVLTHARMTSKDFVRALVRDLDEHKGKAEQHDDITIATVGLSR